MAAGFVRARDRSALRRAVSVECQIVREQQFQLVGERSVDLSAFGMLFECDTDLEVGESMLVSMRAPGTRCWVDAEARVARLVHGRRATDVSRRVGLSFIAMDPHERAILHATLRGHPPPIPARSLRRDYAATVRSIATS